MNRSSSDLVPVDPERHALEARIARAKGRIVEDLEWATTLLYGAARSAGRGLGTLVVSVGLFLAGIVAAAWIRRRRGQVHITFR
jgi:hypothetical protein